ncbi:glycoside hydrolase N-terminal domain-containing protein [Microbacterium sp. G2-8]|uniref:glycosyl hydrolase family 95 catalytic domain-containing protein n=1 Tax=Microbacterium sp. G2-8 TaxID=2842454 RepID=UPI001C8AF0B5|nr:glycoside hydrolase N-terminal domain-containing protein [Microbacterium sp. G2-8]
MHTDVKPFPRRRARRSSGRRLVFDGQADDWLEALPLGNGRLGAMCGGGMHAVLDLNEETLWSGAPQRDERQRRVAAAEAQDLLLRARAAVLAGRPQEAEELLARRQSDYAQAFLPVGRLVVGAEQPDPVDVVRTLDLQTAVHETRAGEAIAETFVSQPAQVVVHAITGGRGDPALDFTSPLRETSRDVLDDGFVVRLQAPLDVAPGHEPSMPAATWPEPGERSVEAVVVVRRRAEQERVVIVAAIETTYAGPTAPLSPIAEAESRARQRVEDALREPYERLRDEHVHAHRTLFDRVQLDLGPAPDLPTDERLSHARASGDVAAADPDLVATLFDYGRYLLISSARPGGLPANLQGVWNAEMRPPWSSNYTLNINAEMNCWASEVTDLPETVDPLIRFVEALAERGAVTAAHDYGAPGWTAHHNSDAWAFTATTGAGHGAVKWSFWPFAGAWLTRHLTEHVAFGAAPEGFAADTLRPLARGAARFMLSWLTETPDGALGTAPSTSPENAFRTGDAEVGVGVSSTMDISLARELLETVVALEDDPADPLAREARRALDRIPTPASRVRADGVLEWDRAVDEADPAHRHVSHLYALYPGAAADESFERAAAVSLDRRGLDSTGWSLAWKLALWARLGRSDRVSALIELVFRDAHANAAGHAGGLYPNLFAAHPPFQIDGNLGYVAGIAECLVQSHRGRIELLPAVPSTLGAGSVRGLVARPGIHVDIEWLDGALVETRLRARPGAEGCVRVEWAGHGVDVIVECDAEIIVTRGDIDDAPRDRAGDDRSAQAGRGPMV